MIRHLLLAGVALIAFESAAHACQCDDPATMSEAERARGLEWMASRAPVVAEVELSRSVDAAGQRTDTYRVVRPLIGDPGAVIPIAPRSYVTSCDYEPVPGTPVVMIFLPVRATPGSAPQAVPCDGPAGSAGEGLQPAGMCTQYVIQAPGMVDRLRKLLVGRKP